MSWPKHKTDEADKWFSLYIRERANWNCERCGKHYEPPTNILHCSHFKGRAKESTRFNPDNCNAICMHCHQYFTANPYEHVQWQVKTKGQNVVDQVVFRSNQYCKKDRKIAEMVWKQAYKDLLDEHS